MIATPVLKNLISYLTASDALTAVYDTDFTLTWSENDDYFNGLNLGEIKKAAPIKNEQNFHVLLNGESAVLTVNPIFKSKRVVSAYIFSVKNSYQVYKMINLTSITEQSEKYLQQCRQKITAQIEENKKLYDECVHKNLGKIAQTIESQNQALTSLNISMGNFVQAVFSRGGTRNLNCNVTALLSVICKDASNSFKDIKRKITTELSNKSCYTKIDYSLFALAMGYILLVHMNLSPLKSGIYISSKCDIDGVFHVTVKSKSNGASINDEENQEVNLMNNLAKKLIRYDCGGSYVFSNDEKNVVSEISIDVCKKNRGSMLSMKNSAYMHPKYQPVHDILRNAVEKEIELSETIKMEASKKKKLDNYD